MSRWVRPFASATFLLALGGCARIMAGYLGKHEFPRGPHYHTYAPHVATEPAVVAHLPLSLDVIATDLPPEAARMLEPLLGAMNGYLDHAGWSTPLDGAPAPASEAPWTYVGTPWSLGQVEAARHVWAPDTPGEDDAALADHQNVIQAHQGSDRWRAQLASLAAARRADYVLLITLGAADYYPRRRGGLTLRMAVDLGTNNDVSVSWLTSQSEPIQVVQLLGLLLAADGRVLRAGAEGIILREPNVLNWNWFVVGGRFSIQHVPTQLTEDDLASLLASRHRDDLEGKPLAWEEALRNLVRQLLERS